MKLFNRLNILCALGLGMLAHPSLSVASWTSHTGQVRSLMSLDSKLVTNGSAGSHLVMKGFSGGNCTKDGLETVLGIRNDDAGNRQVSLLLSSLIAERTVKIAVEDTEKDSKGICILRWVQAQ